MALVIPFFFGRLNRRMNTEQFEWFDGNPDDEDWIGCSVKLVGDKIDLAVHPEDQNVIGVVIFPLDSDPTWATVQTSGRVPVYQQSKKPDNWILLKTYSNAGPRGPLDEYFIR
jgi:hypothetical protein